MRRCGLAARIKVGLMVLTAAGAVFGLAVSGIAQETIKIGACLPMTGTVAGYGQQEWAGIQIANEIQPTVLGKKIELVLTDTKNEKIETANAMSRLIEKDKVIGVLGEAISGNLLSETAKIPTVSPTATGPLANQGKKYAFRACFIDPFQGEVAARFARNQLKAQTAAVIIDIAQDYSVGLANFFVKEFIKQGGKILSTTYIQTGDQDFSAQVSSIQAAKPDIIYAPNYYTEDALMAKQARKLGINVPILAGDGAQDDALLQIGGKAVDNMYLTGHFHKQAATTERAKEFTKRFEAKHKKEPGAFAALGADAYFLLLDAIERANSTDGTKIRDALAETKNFQAVSGIINMGDNGNAVKSMIINKVDGGKFVYVTTVNP
jgi:branched-chain amino acid transport system substrate-binding protein